MKSGNGNPRGTVENLFEGVTSTKSPKKRGAKEEYFYRTGFLPETSQIRMTGYARGEVRGS